MKRNTQQAGFTLLELSIVLVIIGLIVGGITVGADMIRAAELRAVLTEHARYKTAVHTFRDKYMAYPGDMTNAQDFWGVAHATAATCVITPSTGTETCNGDGDRTIDDSTGANEYFRFWHHLANAGLVEGSFSGAEGSSATDAEITSNIPPSKISGSGWMMMYNPAPTNYFSGITYNNSFIFGLNTASGYTSDPVLNAEEAWNLDKKVDDGMPAKGEVVATNYSTCTDGSGATDYTADYDLDDATVGCALIFRKQF